MKLNFNGALTVFQHDPTLENIVWRLSGGNVVLLADVLEPSYNSAKAPRVTLDSVELGDGYVQVSASGINPVADVFQVNWNSRKKYLAVAIEAFFRGAGGIYDRLPNEWFWWIPPAYMAQGSSVPIKVTCEVWQLVPIGWDSVNVSATFKQTFQP